MCNNHQDKQYKYYREDFGNAPVETVHMDLLFDMEEKSTKVKSIQTLKVLEESLKEIRFDA